MKKPSKGGKVVQKFAYGGMSRNDDKSGVAGPGGNRSGNTSKSSTKSGGSMGGGGGKSGGLGITTGKTIHGNTAFGPSGGMAKGYATSKGGSGMGPSNKSFSNFKTLDGKAMYGNMGNKSVTARNANQANDMMGALSRAKGTPKRSVAPMGSTAAPKPATPRRRSGLSFTFNQTPPKGFYPGAYIQNPTDLPNSQPKRNRKSKRDGVLGAGWNERIRTPKKEGPLGDRWDDRVPPPKGSGNGSGGGGGKGW